MKLNWFSKYWQKFQAAQVQQDHRPPPDVTQYQSAQPDIAAVRQPSVQQPDLMPGIGFQVNKKIVYFTKNNNKLLFYYYFFREIELIFKIDLNSFERQMCAYCAKRDLGNSCIRIVI